MPWSSGLESQRGNLTSLLGTLASMKEGKKNRRAQFFNTLLGMGGQLGGMLLQNKLGKQAEGRDYAQQLALRQADREAAERERYATNWQRSQEAALERGYGQQEAEQAHKYRLEEIKAGLSGREVDESKFIPFNIASGEWDAWWGRLSAANPKRQLSAKDFDSFRSVAVQAGAKYGFSREQMEDAVNTLAESYGFQVTPTGQGTVSVPAAAAVTKKKPAGIAEHYQATKTGLAETGKFFAGEGKKALAGIKQTLGLKSGIEKKVLESLAKAKDMAPGNPGLQRLETEIQQAGGMPDSWWTQILERIAAIVKPYVR